MNQKLTLKELKVKSFQTGDKALGGLKPMGSGVTECHGGTGDYNLCCA